MAQSKYTLWKYVKLRDGSWRYKRAAFYSNGKIKPSVVIVGKGAQGKTFEQPIDQDNDEDETPIALAVVLALMTLTRSDGVVPAPE